MKYFPPGGWWGDCHKPAVLLGPKLAPSGVDMCFVE